MEISDAGLCPKYSGVSTGQSRGSLRLQELTFWWEETDHHPGNTPDPGPQGGLHLRGL